MASIIPLKKRRGRKPNVLKHLIGKLPAQNKRKVTLQSNHQNRKNKSSKYRRKKKRGYEDEVKVLKLSFTGSGSSTENNGGGNVCESTATNKELKSSNLSEVSLLSDITSMDSIMDISGPVGNAHSTPKTVPPPSRFQDSPLNIQVIPLESYLLSPELTVNVSISCEDTEQSDSEHTSSHIINTTEITGDEKASHSKNDSKSEFILNAKECSENESLIECDNSILLPISPETSYYDLLFSQEDDFKTAGLTNINLEELADTSSVILSIDNLVNERRQEERRDECNDFFRVMEGEDNSKKLKKRSKEPQCFNSSLVSFNTDIITRELEFITDFVYCKYECPALIQKFLQHNYWENRLWHGANSSTTCTQNGSTKETYHKQNRAQLAQEMAYCNPKNYSLKRRSCTYDNPPVEEISRTPTGPHAAENQLSPSKKQRSFFHLKEHNNARQDRAIDKDKETTTGRWNILKHLNSSGLEEADSDETDGLKNIIVGDSKDNEWLTLSEWWLSKAMDVSEMLELLD